MPSFGLIETIDDSSCDGSMFSNNQSGTFKICWDVPSGEKGNTNQHKSNTRKIAARASSRIPFEEQLAIETDYPINEPDEYRYLYDTSSCTLVQNKVDCKDIWTQNVNMSVSCIARHNAIFLQKIKTWEKCFDVLETVQDDAKDVGACLEASFEKQHTLLKNRIASLRKTRDAMDSTNKKVSSTKELKAAQESKKQIPSIQAAQSLPTFQEADKQSSKTQPVQSVQASISPVEASKKAVAIKRFEELSVLAEPFLSSAIDAEKSLASNINGNTRLKFRMAINKKIGQIANSKRQIGNVVHELQMCLNEAMVKCGNQMFHYCLYVIAKKILDQAETQISLHPPSAFPVAQVIIDLSVHQRSILHLLLYLMMKGCPYAIPRYIDQLPGQSQLEHKAAQGYIISEGNQIEGESSYTERMSGILLLLGAIMQGEPTIGGGNIYGIENGWVWLASVLNIKPQPITPYLICSFLESSGYKLWRIYKDSFVKLLKFIRKDYLPMIPAGSIAAKTRLEVYLDEFFSHNPPTLRPPEGSFLHD